MLFFEPLESGETRQFPLPGHDWTRSQTIFIRLAGAARISLFRVDPDAGPARVIDDTIVPETPPATEYLIVLEETMFGAGDFLLEIENLAGTDNQCLVRMRRE